MLPSRWKATCEMAGRQWWGSSGWFWMSHSMVVTPRLARSPSLAVHTCSASLATSPSFANPILAITRKMHQEGTTLEKPTDGRQKRSQASTRRRQYSEGPSIPTPSRARSCDRGALFATLRQLVSTPASQVCLLLGFAPSTVIVRKIALLRLRLHAGFRSSIFVKNHPFGGCARLCLLI
jgi:hypothetical protein